VSSIEAGVLKYQFDETGLSGAYRNIIPDPVLGDFVLFQGPFECRDHSSYRIGAYGFELLLSHFDEQLGGTPFTLLKGACDLQEATQTSGDFGAESLNGRFGRWGNNRGILRRVSPFLIFQN
jgi:hypothetical protein